ncbi:3719_t:CDS:1, partial [Funneliformis caledonium]
IVKRLQEATKKYYQEYTSYKARKLCYVGNSSRTKRRKNQQQREAAKGTPTLHTFWDAEKSTTEINVEVDHNTDEQTDDEIEGYNWHDKIPATLENLELDIKKENVNSEVW